VADTVGVRVESYDVEIGYREMSVDVTAVEAVVTMGVEYMPLLGNTIRISAAFEDMDGDATAVDDVTIVLYGRDRNVVEEISEGIESGETGSYYYDYTLPDEPTIYYYEVQGKLAGNTLLGREIIRLDWVSNA